MIKCLFVLAAFCATTAFAAKDHPCEKVKEACTGKGFVVGKAKEGSGLWKDCICPLLTGATQPTNAKIPLPTGISDQVTSCKTARPQMVAKCQAKK